MVKLGTKVVGRSTSGPNEAEPSGTGREEAQLTEGSWRWLSYSQDFAATVAERRLVDSGTWSNRYLCRSSRSSGRANK